MPALNPESIRMTEAVAFQLNQAMARNRTKHPYGGRRYAFPSYSNKDA